LKKESGLVLLIVLALTLWRPAHAEEKTAHWVGTWASSPQLADARNALPSPGLANSTLRQVVHVTIGGKTIRVRFSNAFGTTPLTLSSVHVAQAREGGKVLPESDKALSFHGQPSVTIPPGAFWLSDPVDFDLAPLSDLAVTIYLESAPAEITTHPGSRTISYLQSGNVVSAAEMPAAAKVEHWYFLNGVDVVAPNSAAAIVALGDSITDGAKSTTNMNGRWPDAFARRLQADKSTANIGILNEGIGANRLLREGVGPNVLARLDRDVLAQTGARWLIVLEGINDIGTSQRTPTAAGIISAYEQIIQRAHARGMLVYGATILPFAGAAYFNPEGETDRQTVNNWIRTSCEFDAVIDLDLAARDPENPTHLSQAADSGDHLHPADQGYKLLAEAIDLRLFAKSGPPKRSDCKKPRAPK
jgi:lysophospholipase L1-like esterase